jgi:nucleoside-diphosphate-sugar epimerase
VRVLLTGAAGFFGAAVGEGLESAGHDVVGVGAMGRVAVWSLL